MQPLGREHVGADRLDQRHQRRRRGADPVGQRRHVELDAFAGIGRALAGQRQVQAVLGEQHVRQQARPGAPAGDRMRGRRRLGDLLAAPARVLLAHMLDHLPLPRHQLQRLGHVLAELVQRPAAARAGRRHRIDDALARQMLGQRPAGRLAPLEGLHGHACGGVSISAASRPGPDLPRARTAAARAGRAARGAPTIGRTARAAAWRSVCLSFSIRSAWSRNLGAMRLRARPAASPSASRRRREEGSVGWRGHSAISGACRRSTQRLTPTPSRDVAPRFAKHGSACRLRSPASAAAAASRCLPAGSRAAPP